MAQLSVPEGIPPTAKAAELVSAMRHFVASGNDYKLAYNDDEVVIPAGITLFHGTLKSFDYRELTPWAYYSTHMTSGFCMMLRRQLRCAEGHGRKCDPRMYEFITTRPLRLQLKNAQGWDTKTRERRSVSYPDESIVEKGWQGIISPYYPEEEMRIALEGRHFLKLVREFLIDPGLLRFLEEDEQIVCNTIGQTGSVYLDRPLTRRQNYRSDYLPLDRLIQLYDGPKIKLQAITFDSRLLNYSLMRQLQNGPSPAHGVPPEGINAMFGYTVRGVDTEDEEYDGYHLIVAWDTTAGVQHHIFEDESAISKLTSEEAALDQRWMPGEIYETALAVAGWYNPPTYNSTIQLYGIGATGTSVAHRAAASVLENVFVSFVKKVSARLLNVYSPLGVSGPATTIRAIMRNFPDFIETKTLSRGWGVLFERSFPFLRLAAQLRRSDIDSVAAQQTSQLMLLWKQLETSIEKMGLIHGLGRQFETVADKSARDPVIDKNLTPIDWAIRLDLPELAETMLFARRKFSELDEQATFVLYLELIDKAIDIYPAPRCVQRWLFDQVGREAFFFRIRVPSQRGFETIDIQVRRKWAEKIAAKHAIFFPPSKVTDRDEALERALKLLLVEEPGKEMILPLSVLAEMIRDKAPGYHRRFEQVQRVGFDKSSNGFGRDVYTILHQYYEKLPGPPIPPVVNQLMRYADYAVVDAMVRDQRPFVNIILDNLKTSDPIKGAKVFCRVCYGFLQVLENEARAIESIEPWLDLLSIYMLHSPIELSVFKPRLDRLNPHLMNPLLLLAQIYQDLEYRKFFGLLAALRHAMLFNLLALQYNFDNPEDLLQKRYVPTEPQFQTETIRQTLVRKYSVAAPVFAQMFAYTYLNKLKYPGAYIHEDYYDPVAKHWKEKYPTRWPNGRNRTAVDNLSDLEEIGKNAAVSKYGLPILLLNDSTFESRRKRTARSLTVWLYEEICLMAARVLFSPEEIERSVKQHEEKATRDREQRRLREAAKKERQHQQTEDVTKKTPAVEPEEEEEHDEAEQEAEEYEQQQKKKKRIGEEIVQIMSPAHGYIATRLIGQAYPPEYYSQPPGYYPQTGPPVVPYYPPPPPPPPPGGGAGIHLGPFGIGVGWQGRPRWPYWDPYTRQWVYK